MGTPVLRRVRWLGEAEASPSTSKSIVLPIVLGLVGLAAFALFVSEGSKHGLVQNPDELVLRKIRPAPEGSSWKSGAEPFKLQATYGIFRGKTLLAKVVGSDLNRTGATGGFTVIPEPGAVLPFGQRNGFLLRELRALLKERSK